MSGPIETGGPAFPQGRAAGSVSITEGGMTLRDWFAGQALPAIISICVRDTLEPDQTKSQMFAEKAYRVADAMIAARQGGAS